MKYQKVVIISPNKNAVSETFIRAHVEYVEGKVVFLYGNINNLYDVNDVPISYLSLRIWSELLPRRFRHYSYRLLGYNSTDILSAFLKREKVSVVLAEYGTTGADVWRACKQANVPLIIHFHGFDASCRSTLEKYLSSYKEAFSYASYVIGVSRSMCEKLLKMGVSENKLIYNPCGIRSEFFSIQPDYFSPIFAAVGRFVDKKAPYLTLLAFRKVKEKFPDARLIMVGKGELLNACVNLSNYFKLEVEFLGEISHAQVMQLFSKAFCFLQHSIEAMDGDREGTPVAVIEAQASGLPVVSTLHEGIPDVVINGETGFLVEEKDVDKMAEKMILLYQNRELAKRMGEKAKEHTKKNFSMDKHINKLNQLISTLL